MGGGIFAEVIASQPGMLDKHERQNMGTTDGMEGKQDHNSE
jgi:hypothetical protein